MKFWEREREREREREKEREEVKQEGYLLLFRLAFHHGCSVVGVGVRAAFPP